MRRARFGLREAFGGATVGGLPEDGEVALAIGLKRDALASADQIGKRLFPPNVSRRIALAPDRS